MSDEANYTALDIPEILHFIFYPRQYVTKGPSNSIDYSVPLGDVISIGCRFYVNSHSSPSMLFFHGNGEVVSDYDCVAPFYNQIGINLFVADYRGYGASGGTPTFANMVNDSHTIFDNFLNILSSEGHIGDVFVMGRSLGSVSAIELAHAHQDKIKGLVIESGFASVLKLLTHLGLPVRHLNIDDPTFPNLSKMQSIELPTLILHGEHDVLIPVSEGKDLYENAATHSKHLVIIREAGHNDIMLVGMEKYFETIKDFVFGEP